MSQLDTVIRGGTIIDGTGGDPVVADVGLAGGRIAVIGSVPAADAREVVDAARLCVAPGFIDLHSHADLTIHGAPAAETYLRQGVTLLQMGNCGFSPFPMGATAGAVDALRSNVSVLATGLPWDWTDLETFAESVTSRRPGINFAVQAGHHAIRLAVMGAEDRRASEAELALMGSEVRRAADAGATGVSFGLIYAPGSFADKRELEAVARAAADCGLLVSCHIRNETDHVLDAVDEILDVASNSGARLQISHVKAMAEPNHGKVARAIEHIESARREGVDVATDVYPYTASSTTLTSRLSNWAMSGGVAELLRKLGDDSARARVVRELGTRMREDVNPDGVVIADIGNGPDRW